MKLSEYQICAYSAIAGILLVVFVVVNAIMFVEKYIALDKQLTDDKINVVQEYRVYVIDCNSELREGDVAGAKLYDPFGNWRLLTFTEIEYQLQHGGRLVECN